MNSRNAATPGELTIMIAGAAMFGASFLDFVGQSNVWSSFFYPLTILLPLYGVVMAAQIAIDEVREGDAFPRECSDSPGSSSTSCSASSPRCWPSAGS